jgi:hypothetical protein
VATICLVAEVLLTRSFILKLTTASIGAASITTSFQARAGLGLELTVIEVPFMSIKFS